MVLLPLASALAQTTAAMDTAAATDAPGRAPAGLSLLEAVRLALERDPNISLERARLRSAEGVLLAASGRFDPALSTSLAEDQDDLPGPAGTSRETRALSHELALSKEFRNGLTIEPGIALDRNEDLTARGDAVNTGTLSFDLRQPLLRGRGRDAVAAGERSAEFGVAASRLDLRHATSARLLAVVSQYWLLEAAERNLDILRQSEESARLLLDNTRRLIAADVVPAAELVQVEANLAAKESSRIAGERELFTSRQALGREIGLAPAEIAALALPADSFPRLPAGPAPDAAAAEAERFVAGALVHRADLAAARERLASGEVLLTAAGDAVQPQLDLLLQPSYTGLVEGKDAGSFVSPLYRNVPGASVSVSFNLSWPTANRRALGELAQAAAFAEQGRLGVELVAQQIGADVPAALEAVASGDRQLARAEEAVALFERAVDNEVKKLRAGTSTLLDLISQRDRLTSAQQGLVVAHLTLALALVRLRFETGTLLAPDPAEATGVAVGYAELTTLPFGGEAPP